MITDSKGICGTFLVFKFEFASIFGTAN